MNGKVFAVDGKHIRVVVSVQDGLHEMHIFNMYALQHVGKDAVLKENPEPYISVGFELGELEGEDFIENRFESEIHGFAITHEEELIEFPNLPDWAKPIRASLIEDANRMVCTIYPEFEQEIEKVNSQRCSKAAK